MNGSFRQPPTGHTPEAHFAKADRCVAVADSVRSMNPGGEWSLVCLFYAALHFTKGKLIRDHSAWSDQHRTFNDPQGNRILGHTELVREFFPRPVPSQYRHLFDLSVEARYRFLYDHASLSRTINEARMIVMGIQAACI